MKNYLSFGGGVNSVALHLLLLDQGVDFEAVFVDHGADWPETYEYLKIFQTWLKKHGYKPVTVLKPKYGDLYDYSLAYKMIPVIWPRWCTRLFKIEPVQKYVETPCFMLLGIDYGEAKRAKISIKDGIEHRWPLIEAEIDRDGCKQIIEKHCLPLPMKSGCFFCPYQKVRQWKQLRRMHPNLFCKAEKLEKENIKYRIKNKKINKNGKTKMSISPSGKTLRVLIEEDQMVLFEQDEYPPCQCGL